MAYVKVGSVIGKTPNLQIGTVTTLAPDEEATVTITGTNVEPILNFGIPQGEQGEQGEVGTVTTGGTEGDFEVGGDLTVRYGASVGDDLSVQGDINNLGSDVSFGDNVNMKNHTISNVGTPVNDGDAVPKSYIDNKMPVYTEIHIGGLTWSICVEPIVGMNITGLVEFETSYRVTNMPCSDDTFKTFYRTSPISFDNYPYPFVNLKGVYMDFESQKGTGAWLWCNENNTGSGDTLLVHPPEQRLYRPAEFGVANINGIISIRAIGYVSAANYATLRNAALEE